MTAAHIATDFTQGWSTHREMAESLGARLAWPAVGTRMSVTTPDGDTFCREWDGEEWIAVRVADKI